MKKMFFVALISLALTAMGCSTVDYFTKAENQQRLFNMGMTCFQGPDLKAGAAYIIKKEGQSVEPTTSGEFLIGCDNRWFSVICDFTKGPNEEPCSDVLQYDLVTPVVPTAPVEVPVVVPEPAPVVPVPEPAEPPVTASVGFEVWG